MPRNLVIQDVRLLDPGFGRVGSSILIRDGVIAEIDPHQDHACDQTEIIEGRGGLLTPGLIDIHTHGIEQHLYETCPEDLIGGVGSVARYGVTSVLPTLYRVLDEQSLEHLATLAGAAGRCQGASVPGFHLEGPFLAIAGAGAHTRDADMGLLDAILAAADRRVAAMSVSPETPGILPVIERLTDEGVSVFITHTRATAEQTQAAIDAGARHATHFYDVFPVPEETDPGVRPVGAVEAILADRRVSVDFIADGIHVHPMAIRAAVAAKGPSGVLLITDSNLGAGLPDGVYDSPWGYQIKVSTDNATRIHDADHPHHGLLAGSNLTMDQGMRNLLTWLDLPAHEVWAMGTRNPAELLGLNGKGRIRAGSDADLVLWDDSTNQLTVAAVWVGGECVYDRKTTSTGKPS